MCIKRLSLSIRKRLMHIHADLAALCLAAFDGCVEREHVEVDPRRTGGHGGRGALAESVRWNGAYYRGDIGWRAVGASG